jgi:hypothetical protein
MAVHIGNLKRVDLKGEHLLKRKERSRGLRQLLQEDLIIRTIKK